MDGAAATVGAAGIVVADMSEVTAGAAGVPVFGPAAGVPVAVTVFGPVAAVPAGDTAVEDITAVIAVKNCASWRRPGDCRVFFLSGRCPSILNVRPLTIDSPCAS